MVLRIVFLVIGLGLGVAGNILTRQHHNLLLGLPLLLLSVPPVFYALRLRGKDNGAEALDNGLSKRSRWICLGAILLIALFMRGYLLHRFPNGCYLDEAFNGNDAIKIIEQGKYPVFVSTAEGRPTLFIFIIVFFFKLLGVSVLSMRIATAAMGLLTVGLFYLLAQRILGQRVGLAATLLLAVSRWHLNFSRVVFEAILYPLFVVLVLYFLSKIETDDRYRNYALAGIFLGGGLYTYLGFRLVLPAVAVYLLVRLFSDIDRWYRHLIGGLIMFAVASLVTSPLIHYFINHPRDFYHHTLGTSVFKDVKAQDSFAPIFHNVYKTLLMFNYKGDPRPRHNLPHEPNADFITSLFIFWGFFLVLLQAGRRYHLLLLIAYFFMIQASIWTRMDANPHGLRILGACPVVIIFAGVFLHKLWIFWIELAGKKRIQWFMVLLAPLLAVVILLNFFTFFVTQRNNIFVRRDFYFTETQISKLAKQLCPEYNVFIPDWVYRGQTFAFICHKMPDIHRLEEPMPPVMSELNPDKGLAFIIDDEFMPYLKWLKDFYPRHKYTPIPGPEQPDRFYCTLVVEKDEITAGCGFIDSFYEDNWSTGDPVAIKQGSNDPWQADYPPGLENLSLLRIATLILPRYEGYRFHLDSDFEAELYIDGIKVASSGDDESKYYKLYEGLHALELRAKNIPASSAGAVIHFETPNRLKRPLPNSWLYRVRDKGNGLIVEYYNNADFQGDPVKVAREATCVHKWTPGSDEPLRTPFSAIWRGKLEIEKAGHYEFFIDSTDGNTLLIDGNTLHDRVEFSGWNAITSRLNLGVGLHDFEIRYRSCSPYKFISAYYIEPGKPRTILPPKRLFIEPYIDIRSAEQVELPSYEVLPDAPEKAGADDIRMELFYQTTKGAEPGKFNEPRGLAIDDKGNLYVADSRNHRIQVISPQGEYMRSIGTEGSEPLQFNIPTSIFFDAKGRLYISDTWNHRLQVLSPKGDLIDVIGTGQVNLFAPKQSLLHPNGLLYIVDSGHQVVRAFDAYKKQIHRFGKGEDMDKPLGEPTGIALDKDDNIFITDIALDRLVLFTPQGYFIRSIPLGGQSPDTALCSDSNGNLFISLPDFMTWACIIDGKLSYLDAIPDSPITKPCFPTGVAVDNKGFLYLMDSLNMRIFKAQYR